MPDMTTFTQPPVPKTTTARIDEARRATASLPLALPAPGSLAGRTVVMSGGSRGIGREIALAAAWLGANVAMLAKTAEPDPRIPGTIFSAAAAAAVGRPGARRCRSSVTCGTTRTSPGWSNRR